MGSGISDTLGIFNYFISLWISSDLFGRGDTDLSLLEFFLKSYFILQEMISVYMQKRALILIPVL